MNIYYIILMILLILDFGIAIGLDGQERGPHDLRTSLTGFVVGVTLLTLAVYN